MEDEGTTCLIDLGLERRNSGTGSGASCTLQRWPRHARSSATEGDLELDQGGDRFEVRGEASLDGREGPLGRVDPSEEEEQPDLEEPGVPRVLPVAVCVEDPERLPQCAGRPAEVPSGEGELRLGGEAARPVEALPGTERASGPPEKLPGLRQIPELGHRDPAQREGRRVVPESDPLEGTQGIAGPESARRRG